jgi:PKD repeat protein
MRRVIVSLCATLVLLSLAACSNSGPVPGQLSPVTPPPTNNPGGASYQLQCWITLSKTTGHAPMPVNMWASVVGGMPPFYFRWDVNGDGWWDYGGLGVTEVGIHYTSAGLYNILLEVEDSNGQFYQATALVDVKPSGPHAVPAAVPLTGKAPLTTNLIGSASYDTDGYVVLYEWDFESDGVWDYESDTNPSAPATYEFPGTYDATLRVTDDDGLTDEASVQIVAL